MVSVYYTFRQGFPLIQGGCCVRGCLTFLGNARSGVGKQVFPDTIGTDLARRAGTVMGGYSTRCKERSFSNAEFSGVWAYPHSKVISRMGMGSSRSKSQFIGHDD